MQIDSTYSLTIQDYMNGMPLPLAKHICPSQHAYYTRIQDMIGIESCTARSRPVHISCKANSKFGILLHPCSTR